jgi:hypothetical protein
MYNLTHYARHSFDDHIVDDAMFGKLKSLPPKKEMPEFLNASIPLFFVCVFLEYYFAPHRYDLADSIMSLVASLLHEVWVKLVKHFMILIPCKQLCDNKHIKYYCIDKTKIYYISN